MRGLRAALQDRWRWALLLVVLALTVKAVVPGGFMLSEQDQVLTITICADSSGAHLTRDVVVPHKDDAQERAAQHAKGATCPFSALDMAGMPGADPVLLAAALAFILAIGLAPLTAPRPSAPARLRPPLRGPPLTA